MSRRSFAVLLVASLLVMGGCPRGFEGVKLQNGYTVVFVDDNSSLFGAVKARHSLDGTSWVDGEFPLGIQSVTQDYAGVGAGTDETGLLTVVATPVGGDQIALRWGLSGSGVWDNDALLSSVPPLASAPSIACVGKETWFVAYRRTDGTVSVLRYDTDLHRFEGDVSPFHNLNSSANGAPDIAYSSGQVILAWHRTTKEVAIATASVSDGSPRWTVATLDLPQGEFAAGASGRHLAVARANDTSYIAVIRAEPGSPLAGWQVEVFSSANGGDWSRHSAPMVVDNMTIVRLAARPGGRLLIAAIQESGHASAQIYDPQVGHWTGLSRAQVESMFGGDITVAETPFALSTWGPR